MGKVSCGLRAENNIPVPRSLLIGLNAGHLTIEPDDPSPEHGMVPGVPSVPLLPGGGSPLGDPPAIAGLGGFSHGFVGQVMHPVFREDLEEELGSEDTGTQVAVVAGDLFPEGGQDPGFPCGRNPHFQGEDVATVGAIASRGFVVEAVMESPGGSRGEAAIFHCFGFKPQYPGCLRG